MNVVVVGTGFSGAVIARKIAEELNIKVRVIEKRGHIGGNMYDEMDENGIIVQKYGPHIVCTDSYKVIGYLKQYSELFKYTVKLLSCIDGEYVRLPYNFETLQQLIGLEKAEPLIAKMRKEYKGCDRVPVLDIMDNPDKDIAAYGDLLFEKGYRPYLEKQWDTPIDLLERSLYDRVPMAMSYDERFMNNDFQYLPKHGFVKLFENILDHSNIELILKVDALSHITFNEAEKQVLFDNSVVDCLVFTGPIDELFGLKYGELPYRSLDIKYEHFNEKCVLPEAIMSFPQAKGYTRKTEYRRLMFDSSEVNGTVVATEYPIPYKANSEVTPYYPIPTKESKETYTRYSNEKDNYENIFLCGRLAEFKYYNMDKCILNAFDVFERVKRHLKKSWKC